MLREFSEGARMQMIDVVSSTVQAVGYDASARTLRVAFQGGGIYDYYDVGAALYDEMLQPHPWRRVGETVKAHRYDRIR